MSSIVLARGTMFGVPTFPYSSPASFLQSDIDALSNSLAIYVAGFTGAAFFEGQNFTGTAIVITNPGSVKDLSNSPWGNWANRIRSVHTGSRGANPADFLAQMRSIAASPDSLVVVDALPAEPPR